MDVACETNAGNEMQMMHAAGLTSVPRSIPFHSISLILHFDSLRRVNLSSLFASPSASRLVSLQSELLRDLCELIREADGDFKRVCVIRLFHPVESYSRITIPRKYQQ